MPSGTHNGWYNDRTNNRLAYYYRGTAVGYINTSGLTTSGLASGTTITATTGVSVTTGNTTTVAGDNRITVGNLRLGAVNAFAMTEPTSAVVMMEGTNPAGAIDTSGAVFTTTGGATISKLIADGTVSQVEA